MFKSAAAPLVLIASLLLSSCSQPPEPILEPARAKHAVIISIDGCRPDVLLRSQLDLANRGIKSNIQQLMAEGCYTFWAQTVPVSITLPSHTSMLTGVGVDVHGVDWNKDIPPEGRYIYPRAQTIFEVAKRNGLTTAIFASKAKFSTLAQPGTIDWGYINRKGEGLDDLALAGVAADAIRAYKPNVAFMHLGHSDVIGHGSDELWPRELQGWGSRLQIESLQEADQCIGKVVQALKDAGIYEDTMIIVSADHGGSSYSHGANDRARHIPWICVGPGVKKNFDLTRHKQLVVKTEDTFATTCYFLGLKPPDGITGKPIKEVIADRELLTPVP